MTVTLTLTRTPSLTRTLAVTLTPTLPPSLPLTLALARAQAGIVAREACDARRAAYQAEDGGFDAAPFDADLAGGRLKYVFSFLLFPGK